MICSEPNLIKVSYLFLEFKWQWSTRMKNNNFLFCNISCAALPLFFIKTYLNFDVAFSESTPPPTSSLLKWRRAMGAGEMVLCAIIHIQFNTQRS